MNISKWIGIGAVFGVFAVGMGAFGAHALKERLDEYAQGIYAKAVLYQMFHTAGILVVGILLTVYKDSRMGIAGVFFSLGILLFSGSLYVLAISGIRWLGMITPFGGMFFIAGWIWICYQVFFDSSKRV